MKKEEILKSLKVLREKSPKRNFSQTLDLLIQLKQLNLKKQEERVDLFFSLPFSKGKKTKVCAFVDVQLQKEAEKHFDKVVLKDDFVKYKGNKKEIRKLTKECDVFVAQAELMAQIAAIFGKTLGPQGKMPNPKAGCVVPGSIPTLEPLAKKLSNNVRMQTKNELAIKIPVGSYSMKDEELAENIFASYNFLVSKLPQEKNNIKAVMIKFSMGPLYKIGEGFVIKEDKKVVKKDGEA